MRLPPSALQSAHGRHEAQDNVARLQGCVGPHQFVPYNKRGTFLVRNHQCSLCLGLVSSGDSLWYRLGMLHAARTKASAQ